MYHPDRKWFEPIGQQIKGIQAFAWEIYPYFLPHKPHEIFEGRPRVYSPRTFEGIYRHRHQLRKGRVIMPRETRLHQKYRDELTALHEEESTSPDGLNRFTRRMREEIVEKGVIIDRNWFPYRIPHQKCMQFGVWYSADSPIYTVAEHVAVAVYTDGLDQEDVVIWINVPRHKSIPSIDHAQLTVKRYPENKDYTLFQHLPVNLMHSDIYSLEQPPNHIFPR